MMRKNKVFKIVTEMLLLSLDRCNYEVNEIQAYYPKPGFSQRTEDVDRARKIIDNFINLWPHQQKTGMINFPGSREKVIDFVEIEVAKYIAQAASIRINLRFKYRSNRELVKEAREAIAFLREKGAESDAYVYETFLKQKIGEE